MSYAEPHCQACQAHFPIIAAKSKSAAPMCCDCCQWHIKKMEIDHDHNIIPHESVLTVRTAKATWMTLQSDKYNQLFLWMDLVTCTLFLSLTPFCSIKALYIALLTEIWITSASPYIVLISYSVSFYLILLYSTLTVPLFIIALSLTLYCCTCKV